MFCDKMDVKKPQRIHPVSIFGHCGTFFRIFFAPKGPPSIFLMFCDRNVEKSQNPKSQIPFSFFRHCETFLEKIFLTEVFLLQFCLMFSDRMGVEKSETFPLLARQGPR